MDDAPPQTEDPQDTAVAPGYGPGRTPDPGHQGHGAGHDPGPGGAACHGPGPGGAAGHGPAAPASLGVPRTPTGDAEVDARLERLADADHLATEGHVEVYEDVHRGLRDALTALDTRPGPPVLAPHPPRPAQPTHPTSPSSLSSPSSPSSLSSPSSPYGNRS